MCSGDDGRLSELCAAESQEGLLLLPLAVEDFRPEEEELVRAILGGAASEYAASVVRGEGSDDICGDEVMIRLGVVG